MLLLSSSVIKLFGIVPIWKEHLFARIYPVVLVLIINLWYIFVLYLRMKKVFYFNQILVITDVMAYISDLLLINRCCISTYLKRREWQTLANSLEKMYDHMKKSNRDSCKNKNYFKVQFFAILLLLLSCFLTIYELLVSTKNKFSFLLSIYFSFVITRLYKILLMVLIQEFSLLIKNWYISLINFFDIICRKNNYYNNYRAVQELTEIKFVYRSLYKLVSTFNDIFGYQIYLYMQSSLLSHIFIISYVQVILMI